MRLRGWQQGASMLAYYNDPAKRSLLKPEAIFEVETGLRQSAYDISAASVVRTERSEEHTSELQSRLHLVCRLLLEKKKRNYSRPLSSTAPSRSTPRSNARPRSTRSPATATRRAHRRTQPSVAAVTTGSRPS